MLKGLPSFLSPHASAVITFHTNRVQYHVLLLKDIKNCTSLYPAGQQVLSSCVFFPALSPFRKHPCTGCHAHPCAWPGHPLCRLLPSLPATAAHLPSLGLLGLGVGTDEDVTLIGSVLRVFAIGKVTVVPHSAGSVTG